MIHKTKPCKLDLFTKMLKAVSKNSQSKACFLTSKIQATRAIFSSNISEYIPKSHVAGFIVYINSFLVTYRQNIYRTGLNHQA
jgi:hypothetical protein